MQGPTILNSGVRMFIVNIQLALKKFEDKDERPQKTKKWKKIKNLSDTAVYSHLKVMIRLMNALLSNGSFQKGGDTGEQCYM